MMPELNESLVDIRDELASARDLIAATYMASQALGAGSERSALCAVSNAARERLEAALDRLDQVIAADR